MRPRKGPRLLRHKLSASALSTFLKSPRSYYWRYIAKLEPIGQSVATYDHDKLLGVLWSAFVERFYNGVSEAENTRITLAAWDEQTSGWVPEKAKERLTKALTTWASSYYQMFRADDGCRTKSEVFVENERFLGYLDGINDERVLHEVKSTSRSPQLSGQVWKVQYSTQVKLYSVLADASGACIEFAFKDAPYMLYRGPVEPITDAQKAGWEEELNSLADYIYSLGDNIHHYPCHPDGCCMVSKGITNLCQYHSLCDMGLNDVTSIAYKAKEYRK